MADKVRADVLAVEKGIVKSRAKAQAAIEKGLLFADGKQIEKASCQVDADADIMAIAQPYKYVSRAGEKLEKALDVFLLDVREKVCLDIGASTGGFTDCLIQNGAKKVFAVDVGKNQLDPSLSKNPRVASFEETDIREFDMADNFDIIVTDVSFIPLSLVWQSIARLASHECEIVCLVKPQFEVGKSAVGKGGVVKNAAYHERAIASEIACAAENGLAAVNIAVSPIKGGSGNVEYLLHLRCGNAAKVSKEEIKRCVKEGAKL